MVERVRNTPVNGYKPARRCSGSTKLGVTPGGAGKTPGGATGVVDDMERCGKTIGDELPCSDFAQAF